MNTKKTYRAAVAVVALACGILPYLGYAAEISEASDSKVNSSESESETSETSTNERPVTVSVGFDRSSGKYGSNRTSHSLSVPVILSYDTDNYGFALTVFI
jgi:hypothetical protein